MKKSTMILLAVLAVLLIGAAAFCAVFLFTTRSDPPSADTESSAVETVHESTEYKYNEDGQVSQILYYENDVLQGSTDYVYMDDYTEKEYYDEEGRLTRKCTYEDGNTVSDITYTYDANGEIADSAPTEEGEETDAP